MFTELEPRLLIKIEVARRRNTQECFQGLCEACGDAAWPYRTVARWVKAFPGRQGCHSGRPHVKNNTSQLRASFLNADRLCTARELAAEIGVYHKTELHILHDILGFRKLAARWTPHEISEVQQRHRYAVAQALLDRYQRERDDFLGRIVVMDET